MLQERITIIGTGFKILKDMGNPNKEAYYTSFTLRDGAIDRTIRQSIQYWDVLNPGITNLENNTYICVWEEKNGKVSEEYAFYISNHGNKPRLKWSITAAAPYGERAYKITLEWLDNIYESIHKNHIWLKNSRTGQKYVFLKEYIEPMDPGDKIKKDEYIINVPYDIQTSDLVIEGDNLLQQKYLLVR